MGNCYYKAKIIKHEIPDNTGMVHLCDSVGERDGKTGRMRRLKNFPLGSAVYVQKAHFYGELQIYRVYLGDTMDYFSENEIELEESDE